MNSLYWYSRLEKLMVHEYRSNRGTRKRCKNFEFWSFWTFLLNKVGPVHFWCISGVQLPFIQQICYPLCFRSLLHALFPLCRVMSVHCMRSFFLWFLEKTTQFPWTSTVQMFGGECWSCSPRLWSSRYLVIASICLSKLMRKLSGLSRAPPGIRNSVSVILWIVWCDAKQTGKINWNWLDEGNECGLFMFSFD